MPKISILDYGVGNLRSVKRGLEKSGTEVSVTLSPKHLIESDGILLPGVGAFKVAIENLIPISAVIKQIVSDGTPVFGICLGLQLLFTESSEGGFINGLDLLSGKIVKLPDSVKTPQIGWNTVDIVNFHRYLEGIPNSFYAYFVHSYFPRPIKHEVIVAITRYGVEFPSIVAKRNVFATQFHPEKSGKIGLEILKNFVKKVKR